MTLSDRMLRLHDRARAETKKRQFVGMSDMDLVIAWAKVRRSDDAEVRDKEFCKDVMAELKRRGVKGADWDE
jgi:hypothetical protein